MVRLLPGIGGKIAENLWSGWERALDVSPVAGIADPGSENVSKATGITDRVYSIGERLLKLNVSTRSKKMWQQLAQTLDESVPNGRSNPHSTMIVTDVEA